MPPPSQPNNQHELAFGYMQDKRDMKFKKKREYSASYIYLMSQWERQRSHNSHDDVTEL